MSTPPPLVLTVDDEPAITESLSFALAAAGYRALAAPTLAAASAALDERGAEVSAVVLDLALPDGHGFEWLRRLRARSQVPVLILSSHDDEVEHIVGLELGADDYINKPFSPREVVARVRAVLRRAAPAGPPAEPPADEPAAPAAPAALHINRLAHEARYAGATLPLSALEFALLSYLSERPREVVTRQQALRAVWGGGVFVSERTVDAHIKALRKKLSAAGAPELIETVRGVGYRFEGEGAP